MKAEVNQAYVNDGSDATEIPAHSPGTQKSFPSNMQISEANNTGVTSPAYISNSISTVGLQPDEIYESTMVTWHSRKMRQMMVFLVFFVVIALVMTGLFVWRTVFFDNLDSRINNCNDKICTTAKAITPFCRQHAKPKPIGKLPKQITDVLTTIKKVLKGDKILSRFAIISERLTQENEKSNVTDNVLSSIANVVYMDKEIWKSFHGKIDPQANDSKAVDEHSLFPVASVAKVFTSLMVFKLYENKTVTTLDDRFIKYEPKFRTKFRKKSNKIVMRELLSNMAGLPREAPCYPDKEDDICPHNNSVMLDRMKKLSLLWEPGVKPSYSNLGFGLLGNGLASNLNTTYERWMNENLFEPLGMNDSTFEPVSKNKDKILIGNDGKRRKPVNWGWLDPSGGLFTSSADLAKLDVELFRSLDTEGYLSPVYAKEFFAPAYMLSDEKSLIGMPWEMAFSNGYLLRRKNGHIYGYYSDIFLVPELKLAFNVMYTGHTMTRMEILFKNLVNAFNSVLGENATKIAVPANPSAFTGIYKSESDKAGAPGVGLVEVTHSNNEMKIIFTLNGYPQAFQLNFIHNTTFEIWDRPEENCMRIFIRGFDMERVYFDSIDKGANQSQGFRIYGIHPRGWSYFKRVTHVVN